MKIGNLHMKYVRVYRPHVKRVFFSRYANGVTLWAFDSAIHVWWLREQESGE